ncbi:hypothetical protein KDU71_13330 [Carboxylicivirga sediminis]|uniref:Glycerophosphoryl diester phosphodiesterase membrane domain-containing protein n=1 Tax=Carboxylicivirga sediminis TaxID=2006564 RepID=A0A941IY21_9BACT|nr:hypothetical protein [Carboxylicivirga sediminis]MBR8536550.1 hypothetical protein [Carboxylicivirga sediminis]
MTEFKFAQRRDFSSVINAAFEFFKQEGKLFMKTMLTYTGIPVIVMIASLVYMVMQLVNGQFSAITNSPDPMSILTFFIPLFIFIVLAIVVQIVIMAASYGYMKVYHEKGKGNFSPSDVGQQIVRNFFPIIGYTFVISLLIMAGFIFFIIPGIYFAIILSLIFPIMFVEDGGLSKNFNRCFQVIKNHWWLTFAVLIVASLIVGIVGSIISVPLQFYLQFKIPTIAQSGDWSQVNIPFVVISYVLLIILGIYLRAFVYIVTGIQYFSLNENDGSSTIMDRINQIGEDSTTTENNQQ